MEQGPPRFASGTRKRSRAAIVLPDAFSLHDRIFAYTCEGLAFPKHDYDPNAIGSFRSLQGTVPNTQMGGVYWILESQLDAIEPKWRGSKWLDSMTLRPEARGGFGGASAAGWDVYYRRPSKKHDCDWIGVPRFFGQSHFGRPEKDLRVLGDPMSDDASSSFTWGTNPATGEQYEPRPPQKVALEKVLPCLSEWGGTTIEMACGEGKSSLSTCIATMLGRKTLVVVPTRGLLIQWTEALGKHCPSATVGEMREKYKPKKHDKACECDFVITTSRSMSCVDYPKDLLRKFGTVIVDESHEIASRTLSQVLPRMSCRYVIGLTATPQRRDGLGYALSWLMGPCVFRYQRIPRLTLKEKSIEVRRIMFDGGPRRVITAHWCDQILWTDSVKLLAESEERNRMIIKQLADLMVFDGKLEKPPKARDRVAILTLFCEHARVLGRLALEFGYPADTVHVVVGDMPEAEQQQKLNDPKMRMLIGTVQLLGKGFDDPRLDAILLAMPMGSKGDRLQQAVGRTERVLAGKAKPLVIDPIDTFSPYFEMGMSRLSFYRRFGWDVKTIE